MDSAGNYKSSGKRNDHICFMVNNWNLQNSYNLRKIWCNERCYTCGHKQEGEFIQHEKKHKIKIVGLTLCIGMLTGCAHTPESSLVKPKGSKVENAYTETEGVDMVNEDSSENTKDKNTAVRTTIRDLLNAPETYKSQTTDDSAKLVVNTDATVEIPDVEKDIRNFCHACRSYTGSS